MKNAPEAPAKRSLIRPLACTVLLLSTLWLPSGAAGEGVTHQTSDYAQDVQTAAALYTKIEEARLAYDTKKMTPAQSRDIQQAGWKQLGALKQRYYAASDEQGRAFEAAYSRAAEPAIHKLRGKYFPGSTVAPAPQHPHKPQEPDFWDEMSRSWTVRGIIIFLVIGVLAWIDDYVKKQQQAQAPAPPAPPPLSTVHGSAKWAAASTYPNTPGSRGVTFGYTSHPTDPTAKSYLACSIPERHVLITGQTRCGKGTRVIIPTLISYSGSMIVVDPKMENAAVTARGRKKNGHNVYILNPWGILQDHFARLGFTTATYNPIDAIQRDDPNAVATATSLANIICPQSHGARDAFWQMSAANVMTGILLWIADNPREQKTLARAREICTMRADDFQAMLCRMVASRAYQGAIGELLNRYIGMAKETFDGIMAHLDSHTRFLSDPQIKASTATSTFSMSWLRDYPVTIYIGIPHHLMGTYSGWLKMVIAAATESLKARIQNPTPPQYRVMFLIDEFGSMGHFANIPSDIAVMSGYGLDYTLVIQGLDQLKEHYGEAKNTILSNCAFKWFCNISDYDSAKYVSDMLGKATVRTTTSSRTSSTSQRENPEGEETGESTTSTESTSYGETGRHLLTPDEIIKLGRNTAILLHPFGDPLYLKPADYWTQFHQNNYDPNPNMKMQ